MTQLELIPLFIGVKGTILALDLLSARELLNESAIPVFAIFQFFS